MTIPVSDLHELFASQSLFNQKIYGHSLNSTASKELLLRELLLSLHGEVSQLSSFLQLNSLPCQQAGTCSNESSAHHKLLYESVDVIRYVIAILNVQGIEVKDFLEAYTNKDIYLNSKYSFKKRETKGTIIVDIDDVLNEFREDFHSFLAERFGIEITSEAYYSTSQLKHFGIRPDEVFQIFISEGGLRNLSPNIEMIELIGELYNEYTITLLTSRPGSNLKCLYDTYYWLHENNVSYDTLNFSPEKYLWTTQNIEEGSLLFSIDDSPKHISEYCSHGVKTLAPLKSYNQNLQLDNLTFYASIAELREELSSKIWMKV